MRYGVRAGLNLSSVTLDDQDFSLGWQIGAVADIGSKYFFFNPGIIFIGKGTGYSKNDVETTSSMYYIEAPLLLSFKPIPEFRINVGHYVSYGLFGTTETKGISETQKTFDFLDEFDFGLSFGVGVEIMKYYVGLNYEFGLIDIREDKDELERMEGYKETKNQTWALTFGYYF
ncbi:MAG: PorT family protein [Fibromonadales bacterium]|nr:PorT family protein [Fibromonadales bacterium]